MRFEVVHLRDSTERRAWPNPGLVEGGSAIVVRGYAAIGCANSEVHAERQGQRVVMEIVAKPIRCLAIYSVWEPYRAELLGLEPGIYEVRVSAPVHAGEFRGTVSLESGQP